MPFTPTQIVLIALAGVSAYLALYHTWLSFFSSRTSTHRWIAGYSLVALVSCTSRAVQYATADPVTAAFMARVFGASAMIGILVILGAIREFARKEIWGLDMAALGGSALLLAVLTLATDLVLTDVSRPLLDPFGYPHLGAAPGPLFVLIMPFLLGALLRFEFIALRDFEFDPRLGRLIGAGALVVMLMGLTTVLKVLVSPAIPALFDFSFIVIALGFTYIIADEYHRIQSGLELRVSERTAELHAKNVALDEVNTTLARSAREAMNATEAKSHFLAIMGHEHASRPQVVEFGQYGPMSPRGGRIDPSAPRSPGRRLRVAS